MSAKNGHVKMELARIQDLSERLLKDYSYLAGPLDILEAIGDAFQQEHPTVAWEVMDLIMKLRGYQVGIAKAQRI